MSSVNLSTRELAIKIVYYGPGLGGKTTSLRYIHGALRPTQRGQLISLATGSDRTLYFDFLPVRLPKMGGFRVRAQLYTVPGQVHYNATRKLVLNRTDGVVFVADSQQARAVANAESIENLEDNLREQGRLLDQMPLVLQWNKRDLPDPLPVAELEKALNTLRAPSFETIATIGRGIFNSLKCITALVINDLRRHGTIEPRPAHPEAADATSGSSKPASPAGRQSARKPVIPRTSRPHVLTAQSLGELAEAVESLEPETRRSASGAHQILAPERANSLSMLVHDSEASDALAAAEDAIERGEWASGVRGISQTYRRMAADLCGDKGDRDTFVLASLLAGIAPTRFLRFSELCDRVESGGGLASSDALFAVFFLADFALRLEERKVEQSQP